MHLLESARTRMTCIAVTHEVSAVIAAEYFNVAKRSSKERAVAFVTAGPGLTNAITGIAGAWLESREVVVIGGQARSNLLSRNTVRQIGHQEIAGVSITSPITKKSVLIDEPISGSELAKLVQLSKENRKGPVFLEVCLDVTLMDVNFTNIEEDFSPGPTNMLRTSLTAEISKIMNLLTKAKRPLLLVGGGLDYMAFQKGLDALTKAALPVATTWNASDYLEYDSEIYAGRPNTYGMRWSNAVIQQCDLLISIGARLGLQQTGFNVEQFAPLAKIVRVDIDEKELDRTRPRTDMRISSDAANFFEEFVDMISAHNLNRYWGEWVSFIGNLKKELPINESSNNIFTEFVNPFEFVEDLSNVVEKNDFVIPCSSGGAYTTMMQAFKQKEGNLLTNNKGLASMGYGLAGAIGTAVADPAKRVILVEGDGGFIQNLQELGTVVNQRLNIKIFIFDNGGYASIRISQRSYFNGNYLGCDDETGIGLPDWSGLFAAWGINFFELKSPISQNPEALKAFFVPGPTAYIVKVHKEQPFLPKITSKVNSDGSITSNPIHLMHPPLDSDIKKRVFKYLPSTLQD